MFFILRLTLFQLQVGSVNECLLKDRHGTGEDPTPHGIWDVQLLVYNCRCLDRWKLALKLPGINHFTARIISKKLWNILMFQLFIHFKMKTHVKALWFLHSLCLWAKYTSQTFLIKLEEFILTLVDFLQISTDVNESKFWPNSRVSIGN